MSISMLRFQMALPFVQEKVVVRLVISGLKVFVFCSHCRVTLQQEVIWTVPSQIYSSGTMEHKCTHVIEIRGGGGWGAASGEAKINVREECPSKRPLSKRVSLCMGKGAV